MLNSIFQRISSQSLAIQIGIYGGLFILLFLIWDATIRPISDEYAIRADAIEADLDTLRGSDGLVRQYTGQRNVIMALGDVNLPGDETDGVAAVTRAINEITNTYKLKDDSWQLTPRGKVNARLPGIEPGKRIEQLIGEFKFEAPSHEDASAIIAELEANPDITSIPSVRTVRLAGQSLQVNLTLEVWVLGTDRRRGARR